MFDLKVLQSTLEQIEQEKNIPREKILEAIEHALAAAYKKDYGAKGQIIRSHFNPETGALEFFQVKTVVDESLVKPELTEEELEDPNFVEENEEGDERVRFNREHHMYLPEAQHIRTNAKIGDEIIFPLDNPLEENEEFGRVAALTAKQVILQKLREAEKDVKLSRYEKMVGTLLSGTIQRVVGGKVFVELAPRTLGVIEKKDQPRGEWYKVGDTLKVYLLAVEPGLRGVRISLSRTHPEFIRELFKAESPEVATGVVEIKSIAREPGSRSKIAVMSHDPDVDPIGACVGQRGSRINAVTSNLGEEKIDIISWSADPLLYVANSLAPAQVLDIEGNLDEQKAKVVVAEDQLSLAIGKEGQNARLAAKLTGWRIDISGSNEGLDFDDEESSDEFVPLDDIQEVLEGNEGETHEESQKEQTQEVFENNENVPEEE